MVPHLLPVTAAPFDDAALVGAVGDLIGADLSRWSVADLEILITVTQHAFDRLLNEIERRGALAFEGGAPVLPYVADHIEDTILTRGG